MLNNKREIFVKEYLVDLNATQAAIRAGYAKGSADVTGARLLGNASVAAAIKVEMAKREKRVELTQDKVLRDIEAIKQHAMLTSADANGNITMNNYPTALKACELQAKHLGMFIEKSEVEHKGAIAVQEAPKLTKQEWMEAHGLGTAARAAK